MRRRRKAGTLSFGQSRARLRRSVLEIDWYLLSKRHSSTILLRLVARSSNAYVTSRDTVGAPRFDVRSIITGAKASQKVFRESCDNDHMQSDINDEVC